MNRRAFLLGVVATSFGRIALADDPLAPLLAEIAAARKNTKTLRSSFTQERKLGLLATSVKSTGTLSFVGPDRLRWALAPPDDVVYFIGPEGLSYKTKNGSATAPPRGAAVAHALADIRALLGGDLSALGERYVLGGTRREGEAEITGTAKDPKASVKSFVLVLDKSLTLPVRARLVEGPKDTIDITFANAQINVPIDPSTMKP